MCVKDCLGHMLKQAVSERKKKKTHLQRKRVVRKSSASWKTYPELLVLE